MGMDKNMLHAVRYFCIFLRRVFFAAGAIVGTVSALCIWAAKKTCRHTAPSL